MKKIIIVTFLFLFVFLFQKCGNKQLPAQAEENTSYQPFPAGYDYMDTVKLKQAYNQNDIPAIRNHAWNIFAGIMQPAQGLGWPVWYTWPNSVDAFAQGNQISANQANMNSSLSLIRKSRNNNVVYDTLKTPYYPFAPAVLDSFKKYNVFSHHDSDMVSGKHFMSNGDILIPTESLSREGFNWIRDNYLYEDSALNRLFQAKVMNLNAPATYIVTKHMYWPVLAGQFSAVPVWDESYFQPSYAGYAGYEKWNNIVAIDPTNSTGGQTTQVSYLYGVYEADGKTPINTITKAAIVHNIEEFYYHKVTQEDWNSFDEKDKAILNASSYWAYNKPFGVGDFLVTIAMHINTKELASWTMQSAWWTDNPGKSNYSANKPKLDRAQGPWAHYDLVDAYGIPVSTDSMLPVAMNPYIELVIHPIGTNCNNCHMRAGYPPHSNNFVNGANYQNPGCLDMLQKLYPNTPCLNYYMRTDFQWIIPDHANN